MNPGLENKIAVVTGASRGIGRAVAMALAAEGVKVACVATKEASAADTVAAIKERGGEAHAFGCDVSDAAAVSETCKAVEGLWGGVDILVNNAGITRDGLVMRMKDDDFDAVLDVNLKGAFYFVRSLTKSLMKRAGRIINIASVVGIVGNAGQANYAASKGGLVAMSKSLAKELASRQVCVNVVCPGFIETDMTTKLNADQRSALAGSIPLGRFGSGEDVAATVLYLAGSMGAYVTGQTLVVDGGMTM